jgi:aerobic-type carbon monoxide dehydrogenase small subunit (CoxS/CutS family)
VDPGTTLADVLRLSLGLTGTKIGYDCGVCSAYTVLVDGEVVTSCMTLAVDVRGKQVTTIDGLASGKKLHPVQQAFLDHDALQCGFCTR